MDEREVFALGLGLSEPWKLSCHWLDVEKRPHELRLEVVSDRGALFPCPECGIRPKAGANSNAGIEKRRTDGTGTGTLSLTRTHLETGGEYNDRF